MHLNLARIHIDNRRFTAICERIYEAMARYWHDVIVTNTARSR